jgi:hypothetical protein
LETNRVNRETEIKEEKQIPQFIDVSFVIWWNKKFMIVHINPWPKGCSRTRFPPSVLNLIISCNNLGLFWGCNFKGVLVHNYI